MNKFLSVLILLIFLVPMIVSAEEIIDVNSPELVNVRDFFAKEESRTRTELKAYLDGKEESIRNQFEEQGKRFFEDKVTELRAEFDKFVLEGLLKLALGIVCSVLLALVIYQLILRKVEGLQEIKYKQKKELERKELFDKITELELKIQEVKPFITPKPPFKSELPKFDEVK